jgi:glycosyltransferase involved in cell wall biosynthesis
VDLDNDVRGDGALVRTGERPPPRSAPLSGEHIVCFAKDWGEDPTSNNHVMRSLSRHNSVLWLNSIATRNPHLAARRDVRKMGRKLGAFVRGSTAVSPSLAVATPMVLPFPHQRWAVALNRRVLPLQLSVLRRRLGGDDFQLWSFLPTAVDYVGRLGESLVVYYCTDEWSELPGLDAEGIARMDRAMCARADLVFTTSLALYEAKRRYNPETYLAPHGVDHAHFSAALADETRVPSELADLVGLRRPILGFFGLIERWVDLALIDWLAAQRPSWSFVLIGRAAVDTSILRRRTNVRLLGRRRYAELPGFCKAFSLGLIPFERNALTRHVNPVKLREYLSAGLPVVSTPMEGVRDVVDGSCAVAEDRESFLAACEHLLAADSPRARRLRSLAQESETWDRRVDQLGPWVRRAQQLRRHKH